MGAKKQIVRRTDSYPSPPTVEVMRRPTVAIIDDDAELSRAVARILHANYDCVVRGFDSLESFLTTVDASQPSDFNLDDLDLILLDFHLPGHNGPRLVEELRRRRSPLLERSRIMGITADSEAGIVDEFKNAGIDEIFMKPLQKLDYGRIADQAYKVCAGLRAKQTSRSKIIKTYI